MFYHLARIYRKERIHLIKMDNHYGLPKTKLELKQTRRAAQMYEKFVESEKVFVNQKANSVI